MQREPVEKIGQRTATRFLSDAYCKGIVRGQVECCNLRAYQKGSCVVAAERISTAAFCSFPGRALLQAVNVAVGEEAVGNSGSRYVWGKTGPGGRQSLREVNPAHAYGHRPSRPDIWCLSPYEFTTTWELEPLRIPRTRSEWQQLRGAHSDVTLTARGAAKCGAAGADNCKVRLLPGVDFRRAKGAESRNKAYYPSSAGNALCHAWCLRRKARPQCPQMASAPVPNRTGEDTESNAKMTMTYFRAWTLDKKRAGDTVLYIKHLREPGTTWDRSLRRWLLKLPCAETKQYVGNFLSVYRVRPETELDNSDNEDDKEELVVTEELLGIACQTHVAVEEDHNKEGKWSKHRRLLVDALQRAEQHWGGCGVATSAPGEVENPYATTDAKGVVKGLHRLAEAPAGNATQTSLEPSVTRRPGRLQDTLAAIDRWSSAVADGPCNRKQAELCQRVAQQVRAELLAEAGARPQPLRWVVHGGPGTGKSHTLKLIRRELFEGIAGWTHGSQYRVVTLQAVMAKELDGDTIHHAMGLNWQGASDDRISGRKFLDLSAKAVQWRWLIIDEISMVSAELLARMDLRCRELVRDLAQSKYAPGSAHAQPFGGLNVLVAGDLWQLPPPRGTFLGEVPWEMLTKGSSKKVAHTVHGQKLVWGSQTENSIIHGITELEQCERTRDTWLQTLQQQIREGALSADNHAFLHGHDTGVPGSWSGEKLDCENAACQQLLQRKVVPARIRRLECKQCQHERASKKRVLEGNMRGDEQRKLEQAKAVFATNAVKYHVNKLRALNWARQHGQAVKYAIAKDTISSRALQEKPDLGKDKLTWLQRHDQDCGGLYGVLPLCIGMPVTATDHLDRRRGILKGCPGTVVGWSWHEAAGAAAGSTTQIWNELPSCVFVRFQTKSEWRVQGLATDNVFPVTLQRQAWHLDKGRKRPMLRVVRRQFPLAPGFATTAHAAQGQTYAEGAVTDMQIGEGGDPLTAYIAVTRVKDRHGLHIYRPFDAAPYQKGRSVGRALLLQAWRGESIDWATLRMRHREEEVCSECRESKPRSGYSAGQWKRDADARVCRECVRNYAANNTPWQCNSCKAWKHEDAFARMYTRPACTFYRVCQTCEAQKRCYKCGTAKPESAFGAAAWTGRHAHRRVCRDCAMKVKGAWRCAVCAERKACNDFSAWSRQRTAPQDGTQRCNACVLSAAQRAAAQRANDGRARCRGRPARADAPVDSCHGQRWPRSVAHRAIRRLAATRTKVAEEKRQQVIGLVREEIADHVRQKQAEDEVLFPRAQEPNRSKESQTAQSKTEPEAQRLSTDSMPSRKRRMEPRQDKRAQPTPTKTQPRTQTMQVAQAEPAAKCAEDVSVSSQARTAPPPQRKSQAKPQQATQATPTVAQTTNAPPAKLAGQTAAAETFQYACPFCEVSVTSTVRTGQVDHRRVCGKLFRVKDGHVAAKNLVYACPFCNGTVASNVRTGRVDHRTVCGNRFHVKEGTVSTQTRQHEVLAPRAQEPNRRKERQMAQSKTEPEAQRLSTDSLPSRKRHMEPQQDKQAQPTPTKTQPCTQTTQVAQAEPAAKRAKHVSVSSQARTAPPPLRNSHAKPQQETQATPTAAQTTLAPPAKLAGQTAAAETFQYACPFCEVSVTSTVRTGQVDHRRVCGKFFRVKDGHVAAKNFVYACPFCNGTVASNVRTGQIDHRTVCGNQFCVKEGTVSTQTRQHPHTCPACQTVVWSSQLFGRVRCQRNTPAGKPCPKNTWQVQERKHETKK